MDDKTRAERVRQVVAAGRRLASVDEPLGQRLRERLVELDLLSEAGVDLALNHLEQDIDDDQLTLLLRRVPQAASCHVVLSANVCTAALRALALAVACAPHVVLRPSRRDPALAEALADELGDTLDVRLGTSAGSSDDALSDVTGDACVHAYGRKDTLDAIARRLPTGVRLTKKGPGFGIAILDTDVNDPHSLAQAVVVFDQQGCLSPRIAFTTPGQGEPLAAALHDSLSRLDEIVPAGSVCVAQGAERVRYRRLMDTVGAAYAGPTHVVGVHRNPPSLHLPPAARCVHVIEATPDRIAELLHPVRLAVTTVGHQGLDGAISQRLRPVLPEPRWTPIDAMQRPPLDGPADLRAPLV